jgi:hypothetical protein
MDYFTLEALPAQYGDCLLLHYGSKEKPGLILIDGGPGGVWEDSLEPRLKALAAGRPGFRINLMMVSHIDDDHVVGLVDFTGAWREAAEADRPWPYPVREVWHNSFERVSNAKDLNAVKASVTASAGVASIEDVDLEEAGIDDTEERRDALKVLASVAKGKRLRDDLEALQVPTNTGFEGNLVRPGKGPSVPFKLGPELELHIVAPLPDQLTALQKEFAKELKPDAALAAYTDGSVPNLSSIAVVAKLKGKTMLLTGDARGDYLRDGLKQEGKLDANGKLHVDIFKLPHHGSDRNITIDFFEDVTADHYVASADGTFVNPDRPTLEMLIDARGKGAEYVIHLTYEVAAIDAQRHKSWDKDRGTEIKTRDKRIAAGKPPSAVREEWDEEKHGLGALFAAKKAQGYRFRVNAPPEAGDWPKIELLDAIDF